MRLNSIYSGHGSPMVVITRLLEQIDKTKGSLIDCSKIDLHRILFQEYKKNPSVFKDFYFNGSEDFPYSQQIEDVLFEMTSCGMITRPNPTMTRINVVASYEYDEQKLDHDLKQAIENMSRAANELLQS